VILAAEVPWLLLLILVLPFPVAFALSLLVRWLLPALTETDPSPWSGPFSYIAAAYAFIVGISLVFLLGQFENARSAVGDEATSVGTAFEEVELFPESKDSVQHALICYARAVVDFEWKALEDKTTSPEVDEAYGDIILALGLSEAANTKQFQPAAATNIFAQVGSISTAREARIVASRVTISPILWGFVVLGALLVVVLTFLTTVKANRWAQAVLVAFVAALTAVMITLVAFLDRPYAGLARGVSPELLEETADYMEAQAPALSDIPCAFESSD
jgi:hypothetical protein